MGPEPLAGLLVKPAHDPPSGPHVRPASGAKTWREREAEGWGTAPGLASSRASPAGAGRLRAGNMVSVVRDAPKFEGALSQLAALHAQASL
eukprot:s8160_g1.t1